MISKGHMSQGNKIQVFMPQDRINPSEEITLNTHTAFTRSLEFNQRLDNQVAEGDYDYYLTPAQYKKWKANILPFIVE